MILLTETTNNKLSALPKYQKVYFDLYNTERVCEMEEKALYTRIVNKISELHILTGRIQNTSTEDYEVMGALFIDNLKRYHPRAGIEEVCQAVHNLAMGVYGNNFLDVASMVKAVDAFMTEYERMTAISEANRLLNISAPKKPSKEELKKIADESISVMISHYKKTGEIMNLGNSNFRSLWNDGRIRFDTVKQKEYLDKAETIVGIRLQTKLMAAKQEGRRSDVTPIEKEIEELFHGDHNEIKLEAGRLAIEDWLKANHQ